MATAEREMTLPALSFACQTLVLACRALELYPFPQSYLITDPLKKCNGYTWFWPPLKIMTSIEARFTDTPSEGVRHSTASCSIARLE
jgi:hypothetical protein